MRWTLLPVFSISRALLHTEFTSKTETGVAPVMAGMQRSPAEARASPSTTSAVDKGHSAWEGSRARLGCRSTTSGSGYTVIESGRVCL